ncbi:hypothetical protein TcWFU_010167 [Taenia crassiceps]|uniref:Uncharacterized protein n=1 Tax=Taenia crassiceps TaxID=6207 RepID=A0ABR4QEP5_9CEST
MKKDRDNGDKSPLVEAARQRGVESVAASLTGEVTEADVLVGRADGEHKPRRLANWFATSATRWDKRISARIVPPTPTSLTGRSALCVGVTRDVVRWEGVTVSPLSAASARCEDRGWRMRCESSVLAGESLLVGKERESNWFRQ